MLCMLDDSKFLGKTPLLLKKKIIKHNKLILFINKMGENILFIQIYKS